MKNIIGVVITFLVIIALLLLGYYCFAYGDKGGEENKENAGESADMNGSVKMLARVNALGDKLEVEVIESEYTFGVYWIIIGDRTEIFGKDGERITKDLLTEGDTVEILYSGQVMMSYPPQVVAHRITVKEK